MKTGHLLQAFFSVFAASVLFCATHVFAAWSTDPSVGTPVTVATGGQYNHQMAYDGSSGTIIVWSDMRNGTSDIYAQRVSVQGEALWTANGVPICVGAGSADFPQLIPDGSGGAIIVWHDDRNGNNDVYAQRIDANGVVQWAVNGIEVSNGTVPQYYPQVISDENGGAIIAWIGLGVATQVYAQKIDGVGTKLWGASGAPVNTNAWSKWSLRMVKDSAGGAFIAWNAQDNYYKVYAQRIDANGNVAWPAYATNGLNVSGNDSNNQWNFEMTSDDNGGALFSWIQGTTGPNWVIGAQKVTDTAAKWASNATIANITSNNTPVTQISSDHTGGAYIAWVTDITADDNLFVRRVNESGTPQWASGVLVITGNGRNPQFASDGSTGTIITFGHNNGQDIVAQRYNSSGVWQWTTTVSSATGSQYVPQILPSSAGDAIISWWDMRNGADYDIYAAKVRSAGGLATTQHTVTVNASGNGSGWVGRSGGVSFNYPAASTVFENIDTGQSISYVAVATAGSAAVWSGCDSTGTAGNNILCYVTVTSNRTVGVAFSLIPYQVTANAAGNGSGSIASSPAGISYNYQAAATGSANFNYGTNITLTATASTGSTAAWTGSCTSTGGTATAATCTISAIDAAKTVTATFTLDQYALTANTSGAGAGSVSSNPAGISYSYPAFNTGSANYNYGTSVVLTATPEPGYAFTGWGGSGCNTCPWTVNTCTVTVDAAKTCTITFDTGYPLSVSKTGSGAGTVTSSPAGIDCGATCNAAFTPGTTVTLTAAASVGSTFTGWSNCPSPNGNQCSVSMSAARAVSASFTLIPYSLTVNASGSGTGSVSSSVGGISYSYPASSSGSATLDFGTPVTLTAASGTSVVGWTGDCDVLGGTPTSATCTISSLNGNKAVSAVFSICNYSLDSTYSSVVPAGAAKTVNVTPSNALCSWTSSANTAWISITGGSSGTGNGSVQFSVDPNAGDVRTGNMTIAGQTYPVLQGTTSTLSSIGIYTDGHWYLDMNHSGAWNGESPDNYCYFGFAGATPVSGDWDGTGFFRIGVYNNGYWYLDMNGNGVWDGEPTDRLVHFGFAGAMPVVGDWSGTGGSKVGIYYDGYWYLDVNGNGAWDGEPTDRLAHFGFAAATPVVGNWTGTGGSKLGVYADSYWYLDMNGNGAWDGEPTDKIAYYGFAGAVPVTGDWTGAGAWNIGVYSDGNWYLDLDGNGAWNAGTDLNYWFGFAGAAPVLGN